MVNFEKIPLRKVWVLHVNDWLGKPIEELDGMVCQSRREAEETLNEIRMTDRSRWCWCTEETLYATRIILS